MQYILKSNMGYTLALFITGLFTAQALGFGTDPVSSYLTQGRSVGSWTASIGNGLNYYIPLQDQHAATVRGNLKVSPATQNKQGDSLHLKWKGRKVKNEWGGNALYDSTFSIGKSNADISLVKDVAALVLNLKVLRAPNELTKITLQCNNSNTCISELPINNALGKLNKNQWLNLPIPLSCFNGSELFDFSNLTSISIGTQGKMEIELSNLGLAPLPEGVTGC
ncbi:MAG: putative glycoside hydrolase [Paraglaciecola sp.]|uniref:putative glycoside hydrolase n=1 Tax=Paraglaciecola sp. TaxID=1920173 RepID=UPI003297528B